MRNVLRETIIPIVEGRRLRSLRSAAGLYMGDAARALGCSVTRISDIELGNDIPSDAEREYYEKLGEMKP